MQINRVLLFASYHRIGYNAILKLRVISKPDSVHDAHKPWIESWLNGMVVQGPLTLVDKKGVLGLVIRSL